jgi:DNA-directed RNA polymerase specialized sigma24 family protein
LLAVAKKISEFEHAGRRGSFRAWLYQQTRWRIADQFRDRARANVHAAPDPLTLSARSGGDDAVRRAGQGEGDDATHPDSGVRDISAGVAPGVDGAFERLRADEWEEHIRRPALARVRQKTSVRQFQLFDLHVLQRLSVRDAAKAAGTTMAAV